MENDFHLADRNNMNKDKVTIHDVARAANVSPATVSRVLNNSDHPVKPELKEKILLASKQLGYIPNLQARNLKSKKSTSIGIIIPSIANPFYPSIVRGIEDEIVSRNYHMSISSCDRDKERINYSIENMLAVNVQGIISIYIDEIPEAMFRLVKRGGVALNVVSNGICIPDMHTTLGMKLLPDRQPKDDGAFDTTADYSNVPVWKQKLSLVILVLTLLAMIFEKKIGIKLYISGCIGALALIITGVISEKQALNSIDLKTIFLFGGTLSLAAALEKTGAGEMVAETVMNLLGENPSPYVLTFAVFMLCCIMTNFMSNTATTALLVPICVSIAQGMGADPRAVLMACVIGGSCAYATPIGMPANTMVLGAGGYTFLDYTKSGLPLIVIATIVCMIILPIAFPFFP